VPAGEIHGQLERATGGELVVGARDPVEQVGDVIDQGGPPNVKSP
jgi:hypothetical protein